LKAFQDLREEEEESTSNSEYTFTESERAFHRKITPKQQQWVQELWMSCEKDIGHAVTAKRRPQMLL
jgi:hypothetical protein